MSLSQRRASLVGRLRVGKTRAREGAVLVEGVRAVAEAIDSGAEVSFVVTSERLRDTELGAALAGRLESYDMIGVEGSVLEGLSDTERGQGVLLVCAEPRAALDRIAPGGRYLLLDGVQDPGNAGTLIRAAVAFGLDAVVCLDGTVDPWGPKPVRASAGMIFRVPVVRASAQEVVGRLGESGVPVYVADANGEDVDEHRNMKAFALAVGNEARGVRALLGDSAEAKLAVRMRAGTESLNVAMAGAILLHALTRESAS